MTSDGRGIGHGLAAAIFLLALFLRLGVVLQYERHHPQASAPVIDEASYDAWGARIAEGDWLGDEVFFQEPLYPYWLGTVYEVFGHERLTARVFQAFLGACTALVVTWLGALVFGARAGLLAGLAMAVYRPALLLPALLLKPNLLLPVLALLALVLLGTRDRPRASRWLLVGVLAGLGALLRGNVLVLLPCVVVWPVARALCERRSLGEGFVHATAAFLGCAAVLLPVAIRNYHVGGVLVLSTSGAGTNLYGGNNADNRHGVATEFDWVRGIPEHEAEDWAHEAERRLGVEPGSLDPEQVSDYWMGETWSSIRREPGMHIGILWNKLRLSLGSYEVPDNHHLEWDAGHVGLLRLPTGGFGVWGMLGLAGVFYGLLGGRPRDVRSGAALELAVLAVLYLATIVLTVTSMRIRLALVPLLLPFTGAYLLELGRVARAGSARGRLRVVGALVLAAVVVHVPVFDLEARERDLAERDFNLIVQRAEAGHVDEARERALQLEARYPGTSRLQILVASCELQLGREASSAEGRALVERARSRVEALRELPELSARERFRADSLAGWIALETGDWSVAEQAFARASTFDSADAELLLGRARAVASGALERANTGKALEELDRARALVEPLARSSATGRTLRGRIELFLARVESGQGRVALADRELSEREHEVARERIGAALGRLRELVEGVGASPEVCLEGRLEAGRIQLYLGRIDSACNHLRAALALDPRDREARGLLARALGRPGAQAAEQREAVELLEGLLAEREDAELRALLTTLRAH